MYLKGCANPNNYPVPTFIFWCDACKMFHSSCRIGFMDECSDYINYNRYLRDNKIKERERYLNHKYSEQMIKKCRKGKNISKYEPVEE